MKVRLGHVVFLLLVLGLGALILLNVTFRHDVYIRGYGVMFRAGHQEYEVLSVHIEGTLSRRLWVHGFGGGGFYGRLEIEGFGMPAVGFSATRDTPWGIVYVRDGDGIGMWHNPHGLIVFGDSLERFAVRLFEPVDVHSPNVYGWDGADGLIFAFPGLDLGGATQIYESFFDGLFD